MPEVSPSRHLTVITWDDAPHLSEADKADLLASYPPHMRDARARGIPTMGVGAIYPVPWETVEEDPFAIPDWWPRGYGLDVGWNATAAVWGAWDPTDGTLHVYSEYKRGRLEPSIHAQAIRSRGEWIPGVIDSAARGRSQSDGEELYTQYVDLGLNLTLTNKGHGSVEAGIDMVWQRLSEGRLKVNRHMTQMRHEYRGYHRDENGKIVKKDDHLLDALRYLLTQGQGIAKIRPINERNASAARNGMVADRTAGY